MDDKASNGLKAFIVSVAMFCAASIGGMAGFEYRGHLEREIEKAKPLPVRPVVQNPPPFLIPCTKEGRIEHDRVCRGRWRSARIGEKQ